MVQRSVGNQTVQRETCPGPRRIKHTGTLYMMCQKDRTGQSVVRLGWEKITTTAKMKRIKVKWVRLVMAVLAAGEKDKTCTFNERLFYLFLSYKNQILW